MKIKKFTGYTVQEAMNKLKLELGPDAVVLNTKSIRAKGLFKYFKKPQVEIMAGYEEKEETSYNDMKKITDEILEIKKLLDKKEETEEKANSIQEREKSDLDPKLIRYYDLLTYNHVDDKIARNILLNISDKIDLDGKTDENIREIVKYELEQIIGKPKPIIMDKEQKEVFFIGPTGVGKTTTLAKIASNLVLEKKYKVGLITADTYRIGAVDQLKIYSEILKIPLKVIYNSNDLNNSFIEFNDKDIILVDTAGRNHNDPEQLREVEEIIKSRENKDVYLLINSTINYKLVRRLVEKYSFVEDYSIIVTKVDESDNYGNLLNIKYLTNKDLSYITMGQNVPEDIRLVDKAEIAEELLKEK